MGQNSLKKLLWYWICTYALYLLLSCLLCDNHVPGDAINYSLLNIMWVAMHVRLVWSKGGFHNQMVWVCILLEKNIGPLTKAMIHGGSFSLDIQPQSLMRILTVVECLSIKRGVHYLLSMLSRYGCLSWRIINSEKSNASFLLRPLYRRHRGTPLWHLVKTVHCDDPVVQAN